MVILIDNIISNSINTLENLGIKLKYIPNILHTTLEPENLSDFIKEEIPWIKNSII